MALKSDKKLVLGQIEALQTAVLRKNFISGQAASRIILWPCELLILAGIQPFRRLALYRSSEFLGLNSYLIQS